MLGHGRLRVLGNKKISGEEPTGARPYPARRGGLLLPFF